VSKILSVVPTGEPYQFSRVSCVGLIVIGVVGLKVSLRNKELKVAFLRQLNRPGRR
jgi:hypothetical protein